MFLSIMAVTLIAMMSVSFASCSNDDENIDEGILSSDQIMKRWHYYHYISGDTITVYLLEFKKNGTYIFDTPSLGKTEGNYRIADSIKTKYEYSEHLTLWNSVPCDTTIHHEYDATLFKIFVSESSIFDQFWMYCYYKNPMGSLEMHFDVYYNNEIVKIDYPDPYQWEQLPAHIPWDNQSIGSE